MGWFTMRDAQAMRARLECGMSVIMPDGRERNVPPKEQERAERNALQNPPPPVAELFERYKNEPDQADDADGYLSRVNQIAKSSDLPTRAGEGFDLSSWADRARMPLAELIGARIDDHTIFERPARARLHGSRVPLRFYEAIVNGKVTETQPLRDARAWLTGETWAIVLSGGRGVGKTFAGCVAIAESGGGLFVTAEQIAAPDGRELAELAETAKTLVIDEMGDEALTDLALVRLRALLGSRHKNKRRTICTTNLGLEVYVERYGARFVDWLREGAGFREYGGASLRAQT